MTNIHRHDTDTAREKDDRGLLFRSEGAPPLRCLEEDRIMGSWSGLAVESLGLGRGG